MTIRLPRPPRPLSWAKRTEAFVAEILEDALRDGLVALCRDRDGEGLGYVLTPEGQAWLNDFPNDMLACYPDRRERWERA